jgi:hypothetical protein
MSNTNINTSAKRLIDTVKILNDKYEQIEKISGEKFNIFSILDRERNEVGTHSRFIFGVLDPKGEHGYGDLFVRLFLENLPNISDYGEVKNIHAEYRIKDDRRIDFVIETEKFLIGIEMKIDAGDQLDQLSDYHNALISKNGNREVRLYYLTLFGDDASSKSKGKLEEGQDYHLISFKDEIYRWIEKCIEKSATKPNVREALIQYRNLIKKLTNKISNNMEKEMRDLIKSPADIKAAYEIYKQYPQWLIEKEAEFWVELAEKFRDFCEVFGIYGKMNGEKENQLAELSFDKITDNLQDIRKYGNRYFGIKLIPQQQSNLVFSIYYFTDSDNVEIDFKIQNDALENKICKLLEEKKCKTMEFYPDGELCYGVIENSPRFKKENPSNVLFDEDKFQELVDITAAEATRIIECIMKHERDIMETLE